MQRCRVWDIESTHGRVMPVILIHLLVTSVMSVDCERSARTESVAGAAHSTAGQGSALRSIRR